MLRISEPIPALMERRAGYHRAQLLLQSDSRAALQRRLAAWAPLLDDLPAARGWTSIPMICFEGARPALTRL
jgi:primosomal protein N'